MSITDCLKKIPMSKSDREKVNSLASNAVKNGMTPEEAKAAETAAVDKYLATVEQDLDSVAKLAEGQGAKVERVEKPQELAPEFADETTLNQTNTENEENSRLGLFSGVERAVLTMRLDGWNKSKKNPDAKATGELIMKALRKTGGIKQEEIHWLGIEQILTYDPSARFSRAEVARLVQDNVLNITETEASSDAPDAKLNAEERFNSQVVAGQDMDSVTDQMTDWVMAQFLKYNNTRIPLPFGLDSFNKDLFLQEWMSLNQGQVIAAFIENQNAELTPEQVKILIELNETNTSEKSMTETLEAIEQVAKDRNAGFLFAISPTIKRIAADAVREEIESIFIHRLGMMDAMGVGIERINKEGSEDSFYILGSNDTGFNLFHAANNVPIDWNMGGLNPQSRNEALVQMTGALDMDFSMESVDMAGNPVNNTSPPKPQNEIPKWGNYVADGEHTNYRETKIKMPDLRKSNGNSHVNRIHFPADKNVITFIRSTDRNLDGVDGESLHIEEQQSDLHQEGRQKGYEQNLNADAVNDEIDSVEREIDANMEALFRTMNPELSSPDFNADDIQDHDVEVEYTNRSGEPETYVYHYNQFTNAIDRGLKLLGRLMEKNPDLSVDEVINLSRDMMPKRAEVLLDKLNEAGKIKEQMALLEKSHALKTNFIKNQDSVVDAPYKKEAWLTLGLKRMIVKAIAEGKDSISWNNAASLGKTWSMEYLEMYTNQYDGRMVSIMKKLTGVQPENISLSAGLPVRTKDKPSFDETITVMENRDDTFSIAIRRNGLDSYMYAKTEKDTFHSSSRGAKVVKFKSRAEAMTEGQKVYDRIPPETQVGVWHVPITDALIAKVEGSGLTLFQKVEPTPVPESIDEVSGYSGTFNLASKKQYSTNKQMKQDIQDSVLDANNGQPLDAMNEETFEYLVRVGVKDAQYALKDNSNAVGWYDDRVNKAISTLALVHPELNTDENARFAFTWALAVTSNGVKVNKNFELAEKAYLYHKQTGMMPTKIGIGAAAQQINKGMVRYNNLAKDWGTDTLRKFMMSEFTIAQLKEIGFNVTGEHTDVVVRGAMVIGAKVGNGFYSNLYGEFDALTMDRWLMATWGRWTGTLIDDNTKSVKAKKLKLQDLIRELRKDPVAMKEMKAVIGRNLTISDPVGVSLAILKASMLPANRTIMDKTKTGTEIRKIGNSIQSLIDGQKLAPANGGERKWIRKVFGGILDELKKDMPSLTMADLQALVWYPERLLYDSAKSKTGNIAGYSDADAPDYANAATKLALGRGVSQSDIDNTQREVEENADSRASARQGLGQVRQTSESDESKGKSSSKNTGGKFNKEERQNFLIEQIFTGDRLNRQSGEKAQPYKRSSGSKDKGLRRVVNVWKPESSYKNMSSKSEVGVQDYHELDNSPESVEQFSSAISQSKSASKFGAAVYVYPKSEYKGMRLFISPDGKTGFAIKKDGDIVSVFSGGGRHAYSFLGLAVQEGGTKMDAFDTVLPDIYSIGGFVETGRDSWDDKYKPEGWDKNTFNEFNNGEPDVVYMEFKKGYSAFASEGGTVLNQPNEDDAAKDEARGNITLFDDGALITLFEQANLSTFLHESGHLFLDMEKRFSDPDTVTEDQQKILDWLGADDLSNLTEEQQEKWARGFERYIMEGKSPSQALTEAFSNFSRWLVNIYKQAMNLRVELTDDIRGVMDRMLATEEEIDRARNMPDYLELFKDIESAGMTETEFKSYRKKLDQDKSGAAKTLRDKLFEQYKRATTSWWKRERAELTTSYKAQIMKDEPVYGVIQELRKKGGEVKFSAEALREHFDGTIPPKYLSMISKDSLLSLDDVAELYDYTDGAMLIDAMEVEPLNSSGTGDKKVIGKAERLANEEMNQRHGDILNDGTIEAEADAAAHHEGRAELLLLEIKILNRMNRKKQPFDKKVLENNAKELVENTPFEKLFPSRFRRAEIKYAKLAQKELDSGNTEAAVQAKMQQAANFYLYREATEAKIQAEKLSRRGQRLKKKKYDARNVNPSFTTKIKTLLGAYNFTKSSRSAAAMARLKEKNPERAKEAEEKALNDIYAVSSWIFEQNTVDTKNPDPYHLMIETYDPNLLALMAWKQGEKDANRSVDPITPNPYPPVTHLNSYKEMTLKELRGIIEQAEHLAFIGRQLSDEAREKESAKHQAIADDIEVTAVRGIDPWTKNRFKKGVSMMQKLATEVMLHADSLTRYLDGNHHGVAVQEIKRPIDDAITEKLIPMQIKADEDLRNLYESAYSNSEMRAMGKGIPIPHLGRSMSKWEIISVALNWGNESSRQAVVDSEIKGELQFPNGEADISALLDMLDKKDWDFIQSTWNYVDSFWSELARVEQATRGVKPLKVEAMEIVTKHGIFKGGYYPLNYDSRGNRRASRAETKAEIDAATGHLAQGNAGRAQTARGMAMERVGSGGLPILFDMSVLTSHISKVVQLIAMQEAVLKVHRLINSKEFSDMLNETDNGHIGKALDIWLRDVAAGETVQADNTARIFRGVRSGFSHMTMAWNVGSALIQPLGILQTVPVIGFANTLKGTLAMLHHPIATMRTVQQASNFMRDRAVTMNKDMKDINENLQVDKSHPLRVHPAFRKSFFAMMIFTQRYVDTATWLGAIEKSRKANPDFDEASHFHYADGAVRRSQSSGLFADRTPIERGSLGGSQQSEAYKVWTSLATYFFAKGNILLEHRRESKGFTPEQIKKKAKFATNILIFITLEAMLYNLFKGTLFEDEDDEENIDDPNYKAKYLAKQTAIGLGGAFAGTREITAKMTGWDGQSAIGEAFNVTAEALLAVDDAMKSEEGFQMKHFKKINDLGGMMFKYPSKATGRVVESFVKDMQGEEEVGIVEYLMWRKDKEE